MKIFSSLLSISLLGVPCRAQSSLTTEAIVPPSYISRATSSREAASITHRVSQEIPPEEAVASLSTEIEVHIEEVLGIDAKGRGDELLQAASSDPSHRELLSRVYRSNEELFWRDLRRPSSPARRWVVRRLLKNNGFRDGSGETSFLRSERQFTDLRRHLVRLVTERLASETPIHMVSAAASVGLEAFSMAAEALLAADQQPAWWKDGHLRTPLTARGIELQPDRVTEARRYFLTGKNWTKALLNGIPMHWTPIGRLRKRVRPMLSFDERSLLDPEALKTIADADILFLNHVYYLMSTSGRTTLFQTLRRMKPGSVLLTEASYKRYGITFESLGFGWDSEGHFNTFVKLPASGVRVLRSAS